nr:hypothetical protein [Tanacetum cinerariifolium]
MVAASKVPMIKPVTQEVEDSHVTLIPINPDGQQESSSVSSQFVTSMLNPTSDVGMESIFAAASTSVAPLPITAPTMTPSTIATITATSQAPILPTIISSKRISLLELSLSVDENMKKIIKEQVKEQVKVQVSKILPRIEQAVNEQLEAKVLTRSSHSSRTSYALVEAYEADKIILETYGETVTLKRRRDDDADKDEGPSVGPDRRSKRCIEGKETELASALSEPATRSVGRSTTGSKSRQASTSESAFAEEPVQTTSQMEEPSHPESETGEEDQPIVQSSQHPEWFSQPQKPPTPDRDWNKTLPAVHESIQS